MVGMMNSSERNLTSESEFTTGYFAYFTVGKWKYDFYYDFVLGGLAYQYNNHLSITNR